MANSLRAWAWRCRRKHWLNTACRVMNATVANQVPAQAKPGDIQLIVDEEPVTSCSYGPARA